MFEEGSWKINLSFKLSFNLLESYLYPKQLLINLVNFEQVAPAVGAYADWVKKVQHKTDPNGIDVRIEPKFEIPSGEPYSGGWCRPQTDGPALRWIVNFLNILTFLFFWLINKQLFLYLIHNGVV